MINNISFLTSKSKVVSHDASGLVKIWRYVPGEAEEEEKVFDLFVGGDLMAVANERDLIATVSSSSKE